jgi:hypothetical protein
MNKTRDGHTVDGRGDIAREVTGIGYLMLDCLSNFGYSVRFSHAGYDRPKNYAFFVIDTSGLPRVALRHLQTPRTITFMEHYLNRQIVMVNNHRALQYIVALRNGPQRVPHSA